MDFFDDFRAREARAVLGTGGQDDTAGVCDFCGLAGDDVLLGVCAGCAQ